MSNGYHFLKGMVTIFDGRPSLFKMVTTLLKKECKDLSEKEILFSKMVTIFWTKFFDRPP